MTPAVVQYAPSGESLPELCQKAPCFSGEMNGAYALDKTPEMWYNYYYENTND